MLSHYITYLVVFKLLYTGHLTRNVLTPEIRFSLFPRAVGFCVLLLLLIFIGRLCGKGHKGVSLRSSPIFPGLCLSLGMRGEFLIFLVYPADFECPSL